MLVYFQSTSGGYLHSHFISWVFKSTPHSRGRELLINIPRLFQCKKFTINLWLVTRPNRVDVTTTCRLLLLTMAPFHSICALIEGEDAPSTVPIGYVRSILEEAGWTYTFFSWRLLSAQQQHVMTDWANQCTIHGYWIFRYVTRDAVWYIYTY